MLTQVNIITLLLLLLLLPGCGPAIRHLDSTWADNQTVYKKSQPLAPLEIPPELASPHFSPNS